MREISVKAKKFLRLLDYIERIGLDVDAIAAQANLAPRMLAGLDPEQPLPAKQYSRLYKESVAGMQRLDMRLLWAAGLGSEAFDLMCHSMISARTLGEALRLAERFEALLYPLVGHRVGLKVGEDDPLARISYSIDERWEHSALLPSQWDRAETGGTVAKASGLLVWHALCGWLTGQAIEAREMHVAAPYLSKQYFDGLAAVFRCPIYFDAQENSFSFDRSVLERRLVHTVDSMHEFLDNTVYQLIEMEQEPASTSSAIKSLVSIELPGPMPSFADMAHTLHMSESSLRRRLQRENTSYQALKDEVRCEVAINKLLYEDAKIADLAEYLGFTEPSSFVRSFKSWTGRTPTAYRDDMASLAVSAQSR